MALASARTWIFDALGVAVIVAMTLSLYSLVREYEAGFGELDVEVTQEDIEAGFREGYEYHAIYMGAEKVGTLRTERRLNGDGYRLTSEMDLVVDIGPTAQRSRTMIDAFLDASFRLERFSAQVENGPIEIDVEGQWNPQKNAMVVTGLPGESGAREFELPEAPFILHSLRPVLMRRNLAQGDRVSFQYYDPIGQQPVTADITFLGQEDVELMGRTVEAYHFRQTALGQQSHVWVNALGEVLVEEMPMGFRVVREPEAEARYGMREAGTNVAGVEADGRIDPAGVSEPVLGRGRWNRAIWHITDHQGDKTQKIEREAAESIAPVPIIETDDRERLTAELAETLTLETSSPEVREALRAAQREREPSLDPTTNRARIDEDALAIARWVEREIELVPGASEETSASTALAEGEATARGKAMALAATLRAADIPARVVRGVVVLGGDRPGSQRHVEHVWTEAWIGEWIGLDPSLGMFPVDAGYLRLGTDASELGGLLVRSATDAVRIERVEVP